MGDQPSTAGLILRKRLLLSSMQFMFWAAFGIAPFIVVLLREQKLDSITIGLMLSINSFIGIFGQPIWGMVSDWVKSAKKVFILCMSVCTITYALLMNARSPLAIGIILAVDTFFRSPVVSLVDIWCVASISGDERISYGSLRLWGSIGFALTVLFFGIISDGRSVTVLFPFYFILAALTITLSFFIKYGNNAQVRRIGFKELKPRKLFNNYYYLALVGFMFLITLPNTPAGTFLPDLFVQVGGTTAQYGFMHSIKAFLEVPFFFFGKKLLERFGCVRIIIAAAFLYMIQQLLLACAVTPAQVILAQTLNGPAYSLYLISTLQYIFNLAPDDLKATAQTMASALGGSLSSIVGNYGGGLFITYFGLRSIFWTGAISDIITITLFILSFTLIKRVAVRKEKHEKSLLNQNDQSETGTTVNY